MLGLEEFDQFFYIWVARMGSKPKVKEEITRAPNLGSCTEFGVPSLAFD